MNDYKPPFHMTDKMTLLIAEISEQVGRITVLQEGAISPHLRRENRIRTIHSSLAIEHISLSGAGNSDTRRQTRPRQSERN